MKIKIDGFRVCNVCRRCYWFSLKRMDSKNSMCYCHRQHSPIAPFASCNYFEYSVQSDAVYSVFDRGKKL
ncbi:MAG: hypothetical protein ACI4KA_00155 [Oscillospiraceae bacterium]